LTEATEATEAFAGLFGFAVLTTANEIKPLHGTGRAAYCGTWIWLILRGVGTPDSDNEHTPPKAYQRLPTFVQKLLKCYNMIE